MTILVFKTNVSTGDEIRQLSFGLSSLVSQWNFDLEDCDKILRVVGMVTPHEINKLLEQEGFLCEELVDENEEGPPCRKS